MPLTHYNKQKTESSRQTCSEINHNNHKTTPQVSVEVMIDLLPIELMVQKVGISAYIRLKSQLNNPCAAKNTRHIPYMQYWEKLLKEYNIKMPQTDECKKRMWEKHTM